MITEACPTVNRVCRRWRDGVTEARQTLIPVLCLCLVFLLSYIVVQRAGSIFTGGSTSETNTTSVSPEMNL